MHTERARAPYAEPVPRKPMKNRVIRVDDPTWLAAMRAAEARDERLSQEIRKWLERYGKDHRDDKEGK
jgi:hypothetical protein